MTALKQLSIAYLVAASAFAITVTLARHPTLAAAARDTAQETGRVSLRAAVAIESGVVEPGWALLSTAGARAYADIAAALSPSPAPFAEAKVKPKKKASPPRMAETKPEPAKPSAAKLPAPALRPAIVAPPPRKAKVAVVPPRPTQTVKVAVAPPVVKVAPPTPKELAMHTAPAKPAPQIQREAIAAPKPAMPPAVEPPTVPPVSAAELAEVKQRLKDSLTDALYANFDLFLYVSKAAEGPVAQHMLVFAKDGAANDGTDTLDLRYDWIVSTGREKVEYNKAGWKLPSFTPAGYYELDPRRMYARYRSVQWNQPMPHAMFFNWVHDGEQTGLAIHAADGDDISLLGQRASGGCIHLSPRDAAVLFNLVRDHYKGEVPRFAFDRKTHTMSNHGELMSGANGKPIYFKGYKVLVIIQDYGGSEAVASIM